MLDHLTGFNVDQRIGIGDFLDILVAFGLLIGTQRGGDSTP